MRSFVSPLSAFLLIGGCSLWSAVAIAEDVLPMPPTYEQQAPAAPATQSTTTTVTTTTRAPAVSAAPAAPAAPAVPAQPLSPALPPLPPPPMARGPIYYNGPVWVVPAQPGQFAPPLPPPPLFLPPRSLFRTAGCCTEATRYTPPVPRGPVFGIGLRFTASGINQQVFGQNVNMLGGGLQLRFRNRGHWGFETAFDVLGANINSGSFVRTSYPVSGALMLYLFQNRPDTHFNIFGVAGFGLAADNITLYSQTSQERNQQFLEVQGQAGGGIELRFHRLALTGDVRFIGSALDDTSTAGSYYKGVDGGPVPSSSVGYKANVGALLWF